VAPSPWSRVTTTSKLEHFYAKEWCFSFFFLFCHNNSREWSIESRRATRESYDYKQAKNDVELFMGMRQA
jgi:hypothetical protein